MRPNVKNYKLDSQRTTMTLKPPVLNGKPLELVATAKLLGMINSHALKWNMHTSELSKKCSSRHYFLRQLKRSRVAPNELALCDVACIRPALEYASPLFHRSLPNYISEYFEVNGSKRRALRIIYPDLSHRVALETAGLPKLHERRERISTDLFDEVFCDPTNRQPPSPREEL